jgi:foldase protein PrsA
MLALATGWLAPPAAVHADPADAVALVNGEKITEAQVTAELKARWGYQVREQLISALVVAQEAKKKNITVTEAEVDAAYAKSKKEIESRGRATGQSFTDWLLANEYTIPSFRNFLRVRLLLEKLVAPGLTVTDDDVSKYYEANQVQLTREKAVEIAFIAVKTKDEADKLHAKLAADPTAWDKAAKESNLDPYGRDNGGYFGFLREGDKAIQKAAFGLAKDGDISAAFEEPGQGWLLVKRLSYQEPGVPPLKSVEKDLHDQLLAQKTQAAAQQHLQALLVLADIKRLGDIQEPVPQP